MSDGSRRGINRRADIHVTDKLRERFWSRVAVTPSENDCWPWMASMRNGYGAIKHDRQVLSCHRVAYVLTHGNVDDGLVIAHKCDNRSCCNPSHLEAITTQKNNADAVDRIRFHRTAGHLTWNSKFTVDQVIEIRRLSSLGMSSVQIIKAMGLSVAPKTIRNVANGSRYKNITSDNGK